MRSVRQQQAPARSGGVGSVQKTSSQTSEKLEVRTPPTPGGARGGSGGSVGGRSNPPAPPSRPTNKPQPPGRPKPTLPNKPLLSKKPTSGPSQHGGSSGGGGGKGTSAAISVPSPEGMTPRQMVDFFLFESPAVISNVQDGVGNIPTLLENLVTLGEAIADQARGRSVTFRIEMSKFRSGLGTLKTFANVSWYNSVNQIVEEMKRLVTGLNILSQNLSE